MIREIIYPNGQLLRFPVNFRFCSHNLVSLEGVEQFWLGRVWILENHPRVSDGVVLNLAGAAYAGQFLPHEFESKAIKPYIFSNELSVLSQPNVNTLQ